MGMINQPLTQVHFALRAEAMTSRVILVLNEVLPTVGLAVDSRPTDIASLLDIDMKLAWKVSQLLRADSPAEVLGGLPGRSGFLKLMSGLKRAGVDSEFIEIVQSAFDDLLSDINTYAGNKSTYESMVLGLGARSDLPLALAQRRSLITAMSSVIGIYCRSLYVLDVIGPRLESGGFDRVSVVSYDGIFRLWSGIPWCLRLPRLGMVGEDRMTRIVTGIEPSEDFDGRLLGGYSGLSGIKITQRPDTHPEYQDFSLESEGVGPRHAARIVHGSRTSHQSIGAGPIQSIRIDLPIEHCEMDLMIHRSWLEVHDSTSASVFSPGLGGGHGTDDSWRRRLPITLKSSVAADGSSHGAPFGWSLDQHSQLVQQMIAGSGHDRSDYVVRRVALTYPPLPAEIVHGVDVAGI
jgi:hypothetical protein